MRTTAKVTNPDVIIVEIAMTMELSGWKRLREQLSAVWPSSDLDSQIGSVVRQIERQAYAKTEPEA